MTIRERLLYALACAVACAAFSSCHAWPCADCGHGVVRTPVAE
jgi:hypothetical protein